MKLPIHPFLLAAFPILALYVNNIDKADFSLVLRPLLLSVGAAFILYVLLKMLVRDWRRAALISSTFVVLFFLYGHVSSGSLSVLFVFILLFVVVAFLVFTSKSNFDGITSVVNVVGLVLLIMVAAQGVLYQFSASSITPRLQSKEGQSESTPDIYYIVLDGHARGDILQQMYDYDNTRFIEDLREMGFYVAEFSTSNYPQTYQSMAAALNLSYVNDLVSAVGEESQDRRPFKDLLDDNLLVTFLKDRGYQFVTFASGWTGVDSLARVDIHMAGKMNVHEFENVLIETTPLLIFLGKDVQYTLHRNKTLYTFDHLPEIAGIEGPTFTYAHLAVPHPPFVFGADGEEIAQDIPFSLADSTWKLFSGRTKEDYIRLYREQIAYTDTRILETIKNIIKKSEEHPIIILQSDHGPGASLTWEEPTELAIRERMSVLNAYYLPEADLDVLYDTITPVNTFRVVLNEYFDQNYPLLEDKNYFASWWTPYQFLDVTEILRTESK
jgi:hypothetical protein